MNDSIIRKLMRYLCLILYVGFAQWLPVSYFPVLGRPSRWLRGVLCRRIFMQCGSPINVERRAKFGKGFHICLGNHSCLGINCYVPEDTVIGNNVMMGPDVYILPQNHNFSRIDIPMGAQGMEPSRQTVIGNDVWIGREVTMTPGRTIQDGTIIGACCLLCKDFPPYSIIGGNPSKLIRSRK